MRWRRKSRRFRFLMIVDVEGKQILIMKIMIVITDGANNGWSIG